VTAIARHDLEIVKLDGPSVTAHIIERGREHTITLDIPTWSRKEQPTVAHIIGGATAQDRSDLPDRLVAELESAGIEVAPVIDRIRSTGSHGTPHRRHVLAISYALVQRIDEEPRLAVLLRSTTSPTDLAGQTGCPDRVELKNIDRKNFYGARRPDHLG